MSNKTLNDKEPARGPLTFDSRVKAVLPDLAPAEQRMACFFVEQIQSVLLNSAAEIAELAGTSDATVVVPCGASVCSLAESMQASCSFHLYPCGVVISTWTTAVFQESS